MEGTCVTVEKAVSQTVDKINIQIFNEPVEIEQKEE
jgi:hypothetical protein